MNVINVIDLHHNLIDKNIELAISEKLFDGSPSDVRNWLMNMLLFLTYHFACEESLMDENKDDEHKASHRELLQIIIDGQLQCKNDSKALFQSIEKLLKVDYPKHKTTFDALLLDRVDQNINRFPIDSYEGALVLLFFEGGYYLKLFGVLTATGIKRYKECLANKISLLNENWIAISDLTDWDFATFNTLSSKDKILDYTKSLGRRCSYILVNDYHLDKFIGEMIGSDRSDVKIFNHFYQFYDEDVSNIFNTKLVDFAYVGSIGTVEPFYEIASSKSEND